MAYSTSARDFVALSDLHPNLARPNVIGVVIGKTDVRSFPDRKNIGTERFTFGFTLRDSPTYFINVQSWGREEYIRSLSESFRVGDCVTIENPLVQSKEAEREEKFNPVTPSCYKLLLSENHSVVKTSSCYETDTRLLSLLHLPVKDPQDYYSLGDIVANGQSLNGRILNVLAAVMSVGEPKYFTTSDKRKGQRCEVKLYDETERSFPIVCWDNESIQLAQSWIPQETVIFASDVRINFDKFRNCMTATVISKTIITTNPETAEANVLFSFIKESAQSGALQDSMKEQANESIKLETIVDVYTVEQLKEKALQSDGKPDPLYGIIYGYISTLDIDDNVSKVMRNRCSICRFIVNEMSNTCTFCSDVSPESKSTFTSFDILVDLTDHTGTLHSCYLADCVAEETLGCTVHEFLMLEEDQKTALKWQLLLERSKIYFKDKMKCFPSAVTGHFVTQLENRNESESSFLQTGRSCRGKSELVAKRLEIGDYPINNGWEKDFLRCVIKGGILLLSDFATSVLMVKKEYALLIPVTGLLVDLQVIVLQKVT